MKDSVLKISVTIGNTLFERDFDKDLEISRTTLNDDCITQPSLFAWYAILSEQAKDERDRAKENISVTEAELDMQIRKEMEDAGEKVTEGKVEKAIKRHEGYREAVEIYLSAAHVYGVLYAAQSAVSHRKEMLITLVANMRNEFYGEVAISEPESGTARSGVSPELLRTRLDKITEENK